MIPEDALSVAGLPSPYEDNVQDNIEQTFGEPADQDTSMVAAEDRLESIFNPGETSTDQPADKIVDPSTAQPQQTNAEPPVDEGKQPQLEPTIDQFAEASKSAFIDESGSVNTQKVSDYFLSKGKSFLKFQQASDQSQAVTPEESKVDPEKEYQENVQNLMGNLSTLIAEDAKNGFTPEQTMQRFQNTIDGFNNEREKKLAIANEVQAALSDVEGPLGEIRTQKLQATITKNTNDLAQEVEGLIPGMKSTEVLDQLVAGQDYGFSMLNRMFNRDNPNYASLSDEDKAATQQSWFENFQADRDRYAEVAEFGRMKFLVSQIPNLINMAQQKGAVKARSVASAAGGAPSGLNTPQKQQGNSVMEQFFGFDSVS